MEEVCGGDTPYMSPGQLDEHHETFRTEAMRKFKGARKMGGEEYSQNFLEKLDAEIWVMNFFLHFDTFGYMYIITLSIPGIL
jgi:hypothetical protein